MTSLEDAGRMGRRNSLGTGPERRVENQAVTCPEGSRSEWGIVVGIYILSTLYLLLFRRLNLMIPDEGIILQGAQRVLEGQVLYRDFFSFFTPGSYYLLALTFKLFGSSFIVARTLMVVYGGFFPVLAYVLARRVCSRWSALLVAYLVATTCLPYRFVVLHNWDSTLLAFLTLYCAVRLLEQPRTSWSVAVGSFAALTFLFEQSKGLGLALGLAAGFAVIVVAGREYRLLNRRRAVALGLGFSWPFLLTFAYFGTHHSLHAMMADWFWPLLHYTQANRVFYGYQNWSGQTREMLFGGSSWLQKTLVAFTVSPSFIVPVLPLVALGLLGFWAYAVWRDRDSVPQARYFILVCATLSGLLASAVVVRPDIIHLMYLSPLFYLVLAWIIDGRSIRVRSLGVVRPLLTLFLLASFTAFGQALLTRALSAHYIVETRRGTVHNPAPDTVVSYVQAHVPAGETILVYPYLPLIYYLTETSSPIPFEYVQPGMHTERQFQEILRQLEARPPTIVLLELSFAQKFATSWPNTPVSAFARDPIEDFIMRYYHPCKTLTTGADWRFLFMVREGRSECPGGDSSSGGRPARDNR